MQVVDEHGFSSVVRRRTTRTGTTQSFSVNTAKNEICFQQFPSDGGAEQSLHWSLPDRLFLGNELTSYGGKLAGVQRYEERPGGTYYADADVIISGNGVTLSWINPDGERAVAGRPSSF